MICLDDVLIEIQHLTVDILHRFMHPLWALDHVLTGKGILTFLNFFLQN